MIKIYQRYFLVEVLKVFFLFLSSFYFLYVLIDYSSNMKSLHQEGLLFADVIIYYLLQFSSQAEILLPIALTLGVIKVLTTANVRGELVALVSSGISFKKLLRPFFICAFFCATLLYLNFQFLTPLASTKLDTFKNLYMKKGKEKTSSLGHLLLDDGSLLLYNSYDATQDAFFDVFWIVNQDELYRMQTLFPFSKIPTGHYVDHLVRDQNGGMRRKESMDKNEFKQMKFEARALVEAVSPPEWQPLSALATLPSQHLTFKKMKINDREAKCRTLLYHKITIPLLSVLACLSVAPFCLKYKRHFSLFMIYALSLFGLIAFFMVVNSAKILGTSQVIPPLWALFSPYVLCFTFFGFRYATL